MVEIEVPGEGRCQEKTGCYKKKKGHENYWCKSRGDRRCPLSFLVISAFIENLSLYLTNSALCVSFDAQCFFGVYNSRRCLCLHASSKALEHHTFVDVLVCHAVAYDLRPSWRNVTLIPSAAARRLPPGQALSSDWQIRHEFWRAKS